MCVLLQRPLTHLFLLTDSSQMQQVIFVIVGTFLGLIFLLGICFFLIMRYGVYFKHWFHTPPSIPLQIEEVCVCSNDLEVPKVTGRKGAELSMGPGVPKSEV